MVRSCCVVGCETGYKNNKEIVSTFAFPKNEVLQKKWIKAIPRKNLTVSKNTAVCAKHFTDDQIIRTWTSGVGDKQVIVSNYN